MRYRIAIFVLGLVCLLSPMADAQPSDRKSSTLQGTVEQVNPTTKRLSVANEPIPGGMGAMSMSYSVDKEEVLTRVKQGDRITAKMYEGDMTLYEIQVMPAAAAQPAGAPGMLLEDLERIGQRASDRLVRCC